MISGPDLAEEFDQVSIDAGHRILADMIMDNGGKYLFVASPYVVCLSILNQKKSNPLIQSQ